MGRLKDFLLTTICKLSALLLITGLINCISYPLIMFLTSFFSHKYYGILKQYAEFVAGVFIVSWIINCFLNGINDEKLKKEIALNRYKPRPIPFNNNPPSKVIILLSVLAMIALPPTAVIGWHDYTHKPPRAINSTINKPPKHYNIKPPAERKPRPLPTQPLPNSFTVPQQHIQKEEKAVPLVSYIGNRRTRKFHRSGCSSVGQMNEKNMVEFDNREDAIAERYVPCKRCYP